MPQGQPMLDNMGQPRRDAQGTQLMAFPLLDYYGRQVYYKGQPLWRNPVIDANGCI